MLNTEYNLVLISCIAVSVIICKLYFNYCYKYWKLKNVPTLSSNIPFGNFSNPVFNQIPQGLKIMKMYKQFQELGHKKHGGIYVYTRPGYIPLDPEIIKLILFKDFQHFTDRGIYSNEKDQPISMNLFSADSDKWRYLRQKLTPAFTSGKMKYMFDTMTDCAVPMKEHLKELCSQNKSFDARDLAAKYSIDVIGSCAFGIECNSFKDPNAEFRKLGKKINEVTATVLFLELFQVCKEILKFLRVVPFSTDVEKFFSKAVKDTVAYREQNNVIRNDFMQLLIELKNNKDLSNTLSLDEVVAQAFIFFTAGFDTSSGTISFCLFELAQNQRIQTKLRKEIKDVISKHNGKLSYESVKDMAYLQQCVDEVLRKYPALQVLNRECTEDYTIDDGLTIEKGTLIYVPVLAMHMDPQYFPEPEKFDPNRFSKENRDKINQSPYYPFGGGPRFCIGQRFGLMQVKLALIALLKDFEYTLDEKTKLPFEFGFNFASVPKHTLWLKPKPAKD